jgi:hypothetical protein
MTTESTMILSDWERVMRVTDKAVDALRDSVGVQPEAPLLLAISQLQTLATKHVSALVGDTDEWCAWYWLENALGDKGYEAEVAGEHVDVDSIEDLLHCIEFKRSEVQA